ncbi:hypothetical protein M405DRAFT_708081, partial [Rhizopogon salebrosus TDB-379]
LDSCIERQPDIFLTEMQDQLREICGVDISIFSTISSTIRRRGFTRKKIHPSIERDKNDRAAYKMLVGEHF